MVEYRLEYVKVEDYHLQAEEDKCETCYELLLMCLVRKSVKYLKIFL